MRKLILACLLIAGAGLVAQTNLQLHYDFGKGRNYLTSTIERFKPDTNGSLFYFVDMNYNAGGPTEAYFEIARELKFWDGPISAHVEYNGGLHAENGGAAFQINNAYLLGGTYSLNSQDFSKGISLSAMYKLIQGNVDPHNFQLTAVWYMHLLQGKLSFTGFADFWREKTFFGSTYTFLSEPQLWYNFNKKISAGGEIELGYNFGGVSGFKACPTLAVKYNL
ncbi:MAG: DUF5020 family protein [Paludibacter sp.]|nr:DUF5020 family protein [Paludibacter sp.]MDD4198605.1 DUF5020 family protein [Paludibacter sp.]MDD4428213.1 DUF5020 family protein [Paludibacter sp.]